MHISTVKMYNYLLTDEIQDKKKTYRKGGSQRDGFTRDLNNAYSDYEKKKKKKGSSDRVNCQTI